MHPGKKFFFLPSIHRSLCLGGQQTLKLQGVSAKRKKKAVILVIHQNYMIFFELQFIFNSKPHIQNLKGIINSFLNRAQP